MPVTTMPDLAIERKGHSPRTSIWDLMHRRSCIPRQTITLQPQGASLHRFGPTSE